MKKIIIVLIAIIFIGFFSYYQYEKSLSVVSEKTLYTTNIGQGFYLEVVRVETSILEGSVQIRKINKSKREVTILKTINADYNIVKYSKLLEDEEQLIIMLQKIDTINLRDNKKEYLYTTSDTLSISY